MDGSHAYTCIYIEYFDLQVNNGIDVKNALESFYIVCGFIHHVAVPYLHQPHILYMAVYM